MTKSKKYEHLKKTLSEVTEAELNLVSVSSAGPGIPCGRSTIEQEYTVWFSNGGRHLILSAEAVDFALKENLGGIKDSIRYFARMKIEQYLKEAKEEKQRELDLLNQERIIL